MKCSFLVLSAAVATLLWSASASANEEPAPSRSVLDWDYFDQLPSPAAKPLKLLLISLPVWGHVTPLLAVAQELVLRGHEVTFCLGEDTDKFKSKIESTGAKFCHFKSDFLANVTHHIKHFSFLRSLLFYLGDNLAEYSSGLLQHVDKSISEGYYDGVLGNDFTMGILKCIDYGYGIPSVLIGTTLQISPHTYPQWSLPGMFHGSSSSDLSFLQRMVSVVEKTLFYPLLRGIIFSPSLVVLERFCPGVGLSDVMSSSGVSIPHIVPTVMGFEFPRSRLPMSEYVGALISRSPAPLSEELKGWLASKPDKSVVYVSMGSLFQLNRESGKAILEGVMKTKHSLLWSLSKSNQWILDGIEVDTNRVLISEWTPQLSVLTSDAIHCAILHGGFNGVNEALWNAVPIIGLPQMPEQDMTIGRVCHSGLGLALDSSTMTSSMVAEAVGAVGSEDISRNVQRIHKLFRFAGGVRRAADLVEQHVELGYAHLVPGFVRYQWSWIQYYNTDVYLVLLFILVLVLYGAVSAVKCACKKCCGSKQKKD